MDLRSVRYFLGGEAELTRKHEEEINAFLEKYNSPARYSNGYGMTEAASVLCLNVSEIGKPGSIGIPFLQTNLRITAPETGEELSYGQVGEMWFHAPNLMMGYYQNPKATAETIVTNDTSKPSYVPLLSGIRRESDYPGQRDEFR